MPQADCMCDECRYPSLPEGPVAVQGRITEARQMRETAERSAKFWRETEIVLQQKLRDILGAQPMQRRL